MTQRFPAAFALVLLLLPLAALAPAEGASAVNLHINVVSAHDLGCSPDRWTSPDLRVLVSVNDAPAVETVKAQDTEQPLYASLDVVQATLPARITVEVQEAEPGGFFGMGTSWVSCDVAPGAATRFTYVYDGGAPASLVARGDEGKAAEVVLAVGLAVPETLRPVATGVTSESARITWKPGAPGVTGYRLAGPGAGPAFSSMGPGVGSATLESLCDNTEYSVRVIQDADPWHIGATATFRTPNVEPSAPRILAATRSGANATVEWEALDIHDASRFELLAGPTEAATSLRATVPVEDPLFETFREDVSLEASDRFVRVRLVDTGGLEAVSGAFLLDSPQQSPSADRARSCGAVVAGADARSVTPPVVTVATTSPELHERADASGRHEDDGLAGAWVFVVLALVAGAAGGALAVLAVRR